MYDRKEDALGPSKGLKGFRNASPYNATELA